MNSNTSAFRLALQNSIPVMTGYIVMGACLGILMISQGLPVWLCPLSNASMYAGSMGYLSVSVFTSHMDYLGIAITTFLVNARHLFYGISLIEKYKLLGWKKYCLAWLLTDETYSLVTLEPQTENKNAYYIYITLLDYSYWIIGGTMGSLLGAALNLNLPGIDYAMTALFIVICTEQWLSSDKHFNALTGILTALVCLMIFGPKDFLIPSMLIITLILTIARRWEDKIL